MSSALDPARALFQITGTDRFDFLQGLVSNDVSRLAEGPVYAALLSPQGKYLADFFLIADGDGVILDVAEPLAAGLAQRLNMYKLRADVAITPIDSGVTRGLGEVPAGAVADPGIQKWDGAVMMDPYQTSPSTGPRFASDWQSRKAGSNCNPTTATSLRWISSV